MLKAREAVTVLTWFGTSKCEFDDRKVLATIVYNLHWLKMSVLL